MTRDSDAYAKHVYQVFFGHDLVCGQTRLKVQRKPDVAQGMTWTMAEVATWYKDQALPLDSPIRQQLDPWMAPVLASSPNKRPFIGPTAKSSGRICDTYVNEDGRRSGFYDLYDLRSVSVNGFVGCMTVGKTLWLFLKTREDSWIVHSFIPIVSDRRSSSRRRAKRRKATL